MRSAETELHLQVKLSASEATVNGLVEALDRLEGELFATLVEALQRRHLDAVRAGEAAPIRCPRCGGERWVKRGRRSRQLETRRGEMSFALLQTTCRDCERTWSPFVERLGLKPHQRATEGLERRLVGLATEISYRKASRWGERTMGATRSPMTIWRTVQRRGEQVAFTAEAEDARRLELDGTRLPVAGRARGAPVQMAFAIGEQRAPRHRAKRLVGIGLGAGSWPEALPEGLAPELVVYDGERGLEQTVEDRYPEARAQRCVWHMVHKLEHQLWRGDWPKAERVQRVGELAEHLFGPAPPEATRRVAIQGWAEHHFAPGSPGGRYIERAIGRLGYAEPSALRTTGHAERAMRETNRRTDIGAPWSEPGIGNLVRLRLARRHNPDDYDALWDDNTTSEITLEAQVSQPAMSRL